MHHPSGDVVSLRAGPGTRGVDATPHHGGGSATLLFELLGPGLRDRRQPTRRRGAARRPRRHQGDPLPLRPLSARVRRAGLRRHVPEEIQRAEDPRDAPLRGQPVLAVPDAVQAPRRGPRAVRPLPREHVLRSRGSEEQAVGGPRREAGGAAVYHEHHVVRPPEAPFDAAEAGAAETAEAFEGWARRFVVVFVVVVVVVVSSSPPCSASFGNNKAGGGQQQQRRRWRRRRRAAAPLRPSRGAS